MPPGLIYLTNAKTADVLGEWVGLRDEYLTKEGGRSGFEGVGAGLWRRPAEAPGFGAAAGRGSLRGGTPRLAEGENNV